MNKIIKAAITSILVTILAACGTGTKIDWNNARQVKAGMNQQEVTELMGRPYSVTSKGNGQQTWVWVYVNGFTMGTQSAALNFKDGKVVQAFEIPDSFK